MKVSQVAAQLFTLRNAIKTPQDIASSMKRVREIGYEAVQVSGMGPIAEEELVKILDGEGLVCCATHEPTQKILDEPEAIVDRLSKLNCRYTAVPSPGGVAVDTMDDVRSYIERMNHAGEVLAKADMVLTYHNHHIEFMRVDGKLILEMIYEQTDPRFIQGEIDTHWVQAGGGNPATWCTKLNGRLPLLHLKDYGVDNERNRIFEEIGYGNLHWDEIIPAAEKAGTEWYIVEQDGNWANDDPFESLKLSFEYIRDNLCEK
ncbi:MAG: TIM barrel protein [Chitinivibrionales bacterium]|nr:TIM barrel protein [Chitinivibrionales bacterium]